MKRNHTEALLRALHEGRGSALSTVARAVLPPVEEMPPGLGTRSSRASAKLSLDGRTGVDVAAAVAPVVGVGLGVSDGGEVAAIVGAVSREGGDAGADEGDLVLQLGGEGGPGEEILLDLGEGAGVEGFAAGRLRDGWW